MLVDDSNGGLNLVFDADDTLWDSNLHFLEAQAAFCALLGAVGLDDQARTLAAIRRHELEIIDELGYGRRPYLMALHRVVNDLAELERLRELRTAVDSIGATPAALQQGSA
jgi:FMN phosphatase YigB (HAD superfamily)